MLDILKLKKNIATKNLSINKKGEFSGEIKHYPAATKEWFNSIYLYNRNIIKDLPSIDVYVTSLIKSYFNLYNKKFERKARFYVIRFKRRNINMSRVLVGKPEFKHTNDKVVITLFIYNREIQKYTKKLKIFFKLNKDLLLNSSLHENILLSKLLVINLSNKINIIKNIYVKYLKEIKMLNTSYRNTFKYSFFKIENLPIMHIIKKMFVKIRLFLYLKRLIFFNKSKFNSVHIIPLKNLLQKIYKKEVEFNIINTKNYYLNSSLLTQIMAKKLKNRKNRLLRILTKILNTINMPFRNRLEYPRIKPKLLKIQNLIIRNNLNSKSIKIIPCLNLINRRILSDNNLKKIIYKKHFSDRLELFLSSLYPKQYTVNLSRKKHILYEKLRNLENIVLDNLKGKVISGIRIEASGRLSKRLIASRTVFKMRQKGTIRNINSSYRKMSAVLLRGQLPSNVDFSKSKNKTPIGAFGLKGWIGSI